VSALTAMGEYVSQHRIDGERAAMIEAIETRLKATVTDEQRSELEELRTLLRR
jgi:hypothetical protein